VVLERREDPDPEHMRHAAEQPLAAAAHQHVVVVSGKLKAGGLQNGDVTLADVQRRAGACPGVRL